jgi:large subunit ribosomal protein L5
VTLRGDRAWEFLDRLVNWHTRIRDFRGLSPKQFDGHGNYLRPAGAVGLPRDRPGPHRPRPRFDITVVTTATTDDEGRSRCCVTSASPFTRADAK